jgi:hypothetical protein
VIKIVNAILGLRNSEFLREALGEWGAKILGEATERWFPSFSIKRDETPRSWHLSLPME